MRFCNLAQEDVNVDFKIALDLYFQIMPTLCVQD